MKMFMHFTRCIRSTSRLAKAAGFSLGLALAASASADPAKIITQPTNLSPEEGTATSLSAEVSGSPNTYRWHRANGVRDAGNNEIAADTILVVQVK